MTPQNVIFFVSPVLSHLNASFKLADILTKGGANVTYVGDLEYTSETQERIIEKGFNFYRLNISHEESFRKSFLMRLIQKLVYLFISQSEIRGLELREKLYRKLEYKNWYQAMVEALKPDLFLVDIFYISYVVSLYKVQVPFLLFQTKVHTHRETHIPPPSSSIIPKKNTFWNLFLVQGEWLWFYLRNTFSARSLLRLGDYQLAKKVANLNGFPLTKIAQRKRAFQFGLLSVLELNLSPKDFDFPSTRSFPQIRYIGPATDLNRTEILYNWNFDKSFKEISYLRNQSQKKVIYCSLGSIGTYHLGKKRCITFFRKVIHAFSENKDFLVVLSIGRYIDYHHFHPLCENIYVFQSVPQLRMLKETDMMITHGGMQSICECILNEVPMLVYPLSRKWDQHGNAARVVYQKIGLKGNIHTETFTGISQKAKTIFSSSVYKKNIGQLCGKFNISILHSEDIFMQTVKQTLSSTQFQF